MKEFLGILAVILGLAGSFPYLRDVLGGKTRPHLYTWLIWTIVTAIVFVAQVMKGAGPGAWTTGIMGAFSIIVLLLSFTRGTNDVTRTDRIFLIVSLLAIIPWLFTKDPTLSVVLVTFIDMAAFGPTIRKTYRDPNSETFSTYLINIPRHALSILALTNLTLVNYIFPAAILCMNVIVVSVILIRRRVARIS